MTVTQLMGKKCLSGGAKPDSSQDHIRLLGKQVVQGGDGEVGKLKPSFGNKGDSIGQLGSLCFNSDTKWQQQLQGQRKTIRLQVFSLTLFSID